MNNPSLASHLNENYICTYKQVSVFKASTHDRKRSKHEPKINKGDWVVGKVGGNVASYFCDPDGRVLELVVGPVSPARLQDSSVRALEFFRGVRKLSLDQQKLAARKHLSQLVSGDEAIIKFTRYNQGSRWIGNRLVDHPMEPDVNKIARAAYYTLHELKLGQTRFWDHGQEVFNALSNVYGDFPNKSVHARRIQDTTASLRYKENLLLAEIPMATIEDIEKDVFQVLVGQPYRVMTHEYPTKLASFQAIRQEEKNVLAILLTGPKTRTPTDSFREPDINDFRNFNAINNQSERFGVIYVTYDELFGLLSDSGLPPLSQQQLSARQTRKNGVGFVLLDHQGEAVKILPSGTKPLSVSKAMRRIE